MVFKASTSYAQVVCTEYVLYKRPILALQPLGPKWASPDLFWVVARNTYRTLSPAVHRPRFLTRPSSLTLGVYFPTRAFHHNRTIIEIPACLSQSALDGS